MTILAIIGACVLLAVLAFVLPKLSIWPQRGVDRGLGGAQRAGGSAPGPLGRWLSKSFGASRRATNRSASEGRGLRARLPF